MSGAAERLDVTIARAGRDDGAEILALQKLAYQSEAQIYGDFTIAPLVQTLPEMQTDTEEQVVLKATTEGLIIGSVRAHERVRTCFIGRLIVDPAYQGRGLGRRLMREIEQRFATADRFELFTGAKSERNLNLYRKLGYRECRVEQISPNVSVIFMEKRVVRP